VVALAVGVEISGAISLCEFVSRSRDVMVGRRLMTEICDTALSEGMKSVSFLGHDPGFFADVTEGFERQTSYGNVFGGRAFEPGVLAELLPYADNWTFTFGDGDFV